MTQSVVHTLLRPRPQRAAQAGLRTGRGSPSLILTLALSAACSGDPSDGAPSGASGGAANAGRESTKDSGGLAGKNDTGAVAGVSNAAGGAGSVGSAASRGGASSAGGSDRNEAGEAAASEPGGGVGAVEPGARAGSSGSAGEGSGPSARPFSCRASKSPMFKSQEPINLRISADFTLLNSARTAEESGSQGTIELQDEPGSVPLSAKVVARGNSRFRFCAVRPFSVKFPEKQKDNLFEHLGKTVKFVTHCVGKDGAPADTYKAPSMEAYEQRVVMEHSVYQVLDQLGVPSLKTRLVRLTYHDTQTNEEQTHLSFVREPEDEMAQRCGMVELEDANASDAAGARVSQYSVLLLHLLDNFIIQYDWSLPTKKNLIELFDPAQSELTYAPYDFDLAGIFRPDYAPNNGRSLEQNRDAFADWLRRNQSPALFREVEVILQNAEAIRATFEQPALIDSSRAFFTTWFSQFLPALQAFHDCEGHVNDTARPACYVSDDHGAAAEGATLVEPGEIMTRIEPPGDVDMFAVAVQAGTLYTLGGKAKVELLDAGGNVEATTSEAAPLSFRAPRAGTFYLRASLGEDLVVSPFYATDDLINRTVYLYPDDAGNSVETAVTLSPGQTWNGKWELSAGEDQDWFLLHVDGSTSLHVALGLEDGGQGWVDVTRRDAPPDEPPASGDLSRGDNDLSYLFGEPGDYIVKLVQASIGKSISYTVELK
jgi:hypothetical protein